MKLNRLLVTNYLKKILITIISLSVFLTPALAFASDVSDQEQAPLEVEEAPYYAPDLDHQRIMETALEIKAATATEYTTTDIYNLLYSAIRGSSSSTTYSLPYIANRANSIYTRLGSMQTNDITTQGIIQDIYTKTSDLVSIFAGTTTGMNPFFDFFYIEAGSQTYSVADLTGMIWSLVQDLNSTSSSQLSSLSSINSTLNSILQNDSISWRNRDSSFLGYSYTLDNFSLFNITQNTAVSNHFIYAVYNSSGLSLSRPYVFHVFIPAQESTFPIFNKPTIRLFAEYESDHFNEVTQNYYYRVLTSRRGIDLFFTFQVPVQTSYRFCVRVDDINYLYNITPTCEMLFYGDNGYLEYLDFIMQGQLYDNLSNLTSEVASPDIIQAKQESQEVIDDTLDNFTGSGGAAAQKSDTSSMKDISVSVKSGINGGGSTSNATAVLNPSSVSGQTFWIWFSTTTKNNVENPYPAPVVNNTRKGSDGDEIIDTLSGYQEQLKNLLGGDSK